MRICSENKIYSMGPDNKPCTVIKPGCIVVLETMDCYDGMVKTEDEDGSNIDRSRINPATGPLYVEGAGVKDTLAVDILDIKVSNTGIMRISPNFGVLRQYVSSSKFKFINIKDNIAVFSSSMALPIKPMVGVIGTSPPVCRIGNELPGEHGGNIDTREITKGSRVYLPVAVEGGLLALGDVHASMGDGETSGTGIEVCAEVVIRVEIIKYTGQTRPYVETEHDFFLVCSAETLEEASKLAVMDCTHFLMKRLNVEFNDAYMLTSAYCSLMISQVVNPLVTVKMRVPKFLFK